jgi:hypothetical protein
MAAQDLPEAHARQVPAARVHEQEVVARARGEHRARALQVLAHRALGGAPERHHALAPPLARHRDGARLEVDAAALEPAHLGDAQPARVRQLEHGAVAQREQAVA